jgi:hypothetical protein
MTTIEHAVEEGVRIVRAQERLAAMLRPMEYELALIDEVLEVAPELAPEMAAVSGRLSETLDHLRAAVKVLQAKVELI